MSKLVPLVRTRMSEEELRDALRGGHVLQFEEEPSERRLGVAWAQCALETGVGQSSWNWNMANIKCAGWPACTSLKPILPEGSTEPPLQRAYESAVAGAKDYWRLLTIERYESRGVLDAFDDGDPVEAAKRLREGGFYGAPLSRYSRAMAQHYRHYAETWAPNILKPRRSPGIGTPGMLLVFGAVGLGVLMLSRGMGRVIDLKGWG